MRTYNKMNEDFKGVIVEESLIDNRILNDLEIEKIKITTEDKPNERWHLYTIKISKEKIEALNKNIRPNWYMHFWKGKEVIVIFKDKIFSFNYDKKETWKPAIDYGLSIGISREQLDFPIG